MIFSYCLWGLHISMKIVYYDTDDNNPFEVKVSFLESIDDEYVVKDFQKIDEGIITFLNHIGEEIFIFLPVNDGEDFCLKYFNHLNYFDNQDNNFKLGSLLSHTLARDDHQGNLLKMVRNIYETGNERNGKVKYLTDEGKLIKSLDYHYFMMDDKFIAVHEDKTEIRMYRESTLNDKDLGVAIYQNNTFVEVNEKYARTVGKTREQLLGAAQDLRGVPEDMAKTIKEQVEAIYNQKKLSYKTPMVSYDENGDIRYYINAEGSYITYDNMPAVLFKIKDLTQQERAKKLIENSDDDKVRLKSTIDNLGRYSKTFISYAIYPDNYDVSNNFYDVIEDESRDYPFKKDTLRDFVIGSDLKLYDSMISSLSPANPEVEFTTSIMTLKFNIKYIRHYFKRLYDSEGNATSYISAHQDITEEATYSNMLKKHIYDKNEIIKDKDVQIKEAHHTIKNNLNILLSLIRMEEHSHKSAEDIVRDTKSHLNAISVMHEKMYQSKTLKDIELKDYVDSIVSSLFDIYSSKIRYVSHVDKFSLNSQQAGTLGLIINELINNTVKYAFAEDNPGTVKISIARIDKEIEVEYRDNGVGLPESVDFDNPSTLGLIVVQNLTRQLDGRISYVYDNGCCIRIVFKEKESF